nr:TonB family protein [uncultured Cetobacterium sp.]
MNRFHGYSLVVHVIVFFIAFQVMKPEVEKLKFVQKRTMAVSLQNRRAKSSDAQVNKTVTQETKPVEPVKKEEEVTKKEEQVVKEEKKIEEKKEIISKEKPKKIAEKAKKKIAEKPKKKVEKVTNQPVKKKEIKEVQNKKQTVEKPKAVYNEFQDKNRFTLGDDGVFTAVVADGIKFEILKEIDPKYPIMAKKMGYKGKGEVTVGFVVNLNGDVENIEFISGENKYGFKEEVFKALKRWKFKPIVYKNKKIKVNFEKSFIFK